MGGVCLQGGLQTHFYQARAHTHTQTHVDTQYKGHRMKLLNTLTTQLNTLLLLGQLLPLSGVDFAFHFIDSML